MPEVHAILSASSSKRWLNCTPSARLEQNFPNESSVYAEEGTAAHALGEYMQADLHEVSTISAIIVFSATTVWMASWFPTRTLGL